MKYKIKTRYQCTSYEEEISKEKYEILKSSKYKILETISIEEKFDIVLENYKEVEKLLFSIALQTKMYQEVDDDHRLDQSRELSRLISNLLSSTKLYFDHLMGHLSAIYTKNSKEFKSVIECKNKHYDNSFSYRLLEALRNHVQHAGLPFSYSAHSQWHNEFKYMVNISTPVLIVDDLRASSKFKKSVLKEIPDNEKEIDLKNHIRAYVGLLSEINEHVRELVNNDYKYWEEQISSVISKCSDELKLKTGANIVLDLTFENDAANSSTSLFMKFLNLRQNYIMKNHVLVSFEKRYISTIEKKLFN